MCALPFPREQGQPTIAPGARADKPSSRVVGTTKVARGAVDCVGVRWSLLH